MLHIILLILKIIGITLASILGLLFLLLLLILLVPIRYRIGAEYYDVPEGEAKISWLLRIVLLKIRYHDSSPVVKLHIFGILVLDSSKEKKKKKSKSNKTKKRFQFKKKSKKKDNSQKEENNKEQGYLGLPKDFDQDTEFTDDEWDIPFKDEWREHYNRIELEESLEENSTPSNHESKDDNMNGDKAILDSISQQKHKGRKQKKSLKFKIKQVLKKISRTFSSIRESFHNIKNSIRLLLDKIEKVKEFVFDEQNKLGFMGAFRYLLKYIRHFAPAKFKTVIRFGTGDPCLTGQILGFASSVIPIYHESIQITPDFEKFVLEGSIYAKGRIRLLTLLIITLKIFFDKDLKNLRESFYKLKEEL